MLAQLVTAHEAKDAGIYGFTHNFERPVLAVVSPTLQELRQKYGKTAVLPYRGFPSVNRRGV